MLFQDPPNALNGIVLAVIRGIVSQLKGQFGAIGQVGQACHKLGMAGVIFGAIVEVEQQAGDVREGVAIVVPEMLDTIDHEIGSDVRGTPIKIHLVQFGQENSEQGQDLVRGKVVVGSV